jgi:hypothetical protein
MDSFSVKTTLTLADWQTYLRAFGRKLQAESNSPLQTILYGLAAGAGAGAYALLLALHVPILIGSLFGGLAIGIGLVWIGARRNRGRTRPDADGMVLGSRTMQFDSNGIKIEHTGWSALIDWPCLREVEIEPDHL